MSAARRSRSSRWNPEAVRHHVENGDGAPFYLLHGDEAYRRDGLYEWLMERLRPDAAADFNVDRFHGDALDPQRLLDVYYSYPMMATHRVVALRNVERLTPPLCKALEPIVEDPSESSVLLAVGGKVDMRRRFFSQLAKQGIGCEFRVPYDNQLPEVIREMAAERNLQPSAGAVERLGMYVGTQLAELANELDKLSLFVGGAGAVKDEDVEALVGTRGESVFDFTDAVGRADRRGAAGLLHALLEQGEEPNRILPLMARHLQLLLRTQQLEKEGLPKDRMARSLGVAPFFLKSYRQQARRFSSLALWRGLSALRRTDDLLKGGGGRTRSRAVLDLCLAALVPPRPGTTPGLTRKDAPQYIGH